MSTGTRSRRLSLARALSHSDAGFVVHDGRFGARAWRGLQNAEGAAPVRCYVHRSAMFEALKRPSQAQW